MSEEIRGLFRFGELEIGDKFKFERSNPNRCAGILFEKNELQHNSLREGDEWNIHCVKYPEMEEFHLYLENDTVVEVDWDTAVRINARKALLAKTVPLKQTLPFGNLQPGEFFTFENSLFIKTIELATNSNDPAFFGNMEKCGNAINLNAGELADFEDEVSVEKTGKTI